MPEDEVPDNDNEVYESLMETTEYIKRELSMEACMLGSSLEQDQFIFEVSYIHTQAVFMLLGYDFSRFSWFILLECW